jgi:beta-ribofuranosylaminobenzene 5'-phosphate synthase
MIEVRTSARLHLGLLDNNGEQGRLYGSIGVAISQPRLVLRAKVSDRLQIEGLEAERISTYAQRFMARYGLSTGVHLQLLSGIPAHVGLGSGTQLALAVGSAIARLAGLRLSIAEIALAVGRGVHSGIGIATFQHGGFVLDGGHRLLSDNNGSFTKNERKRQTGKDSVPPLLIKHPMPENGFFVMIIPKADPGFSGEKEQGAFLQLPVAPSNLVEKISWVLLMKMLPALVEKDIANFGQALTSIQYMVGDCFASAQGGRFAAPLLEKLVDFLLAKGAAGAGQSSWGPTVYGLVQGREQAQTLARDAQNFLDGLGGGQALCVRSHNRGAQVRSIAALVGD